MAKKSVNRSQAIREFVEAKPGAKPKIIAEALSKKGIRVTPQYVSTILSNSKKRSGKTRSRKPNVNDSASIEELLMAKEMVQKVGTVQKAKEVLASYAELMT